MSSYRVARRGIPGLRGHEVFRTSFAERRVSIPRGRMRMGRRLREGEVMTMQVLHERTHSNREMAQKRGSTRSRCATHWGVRAVENGFSVAFHRLEDLLAALKRDAEVGPQRLRRRKHMNVALLVIDKVGFDSMTRQEARFLPLWPRLDPNHDQQGHRRLARGAGRRRGAGDRDPRSPLAPQPRAQHQRPELSAPGPGAGAASPQGTLTTTIAGVRRLQRYAVRCRHPGKTSCQHCNICIYKYHASFSRENCRATLDPKAEAVSSTAFAEGGRR